MKKTSTKRTKTTSTTSKKIVNKTPKKVEQYIGLPMLTEPTSHDVHDELARLDSYAYSRYNN